MNANGGLWVQYALQSDDLAVKVNGRGDEQWPWHGVVHSDRWFLYTENLAKNVNVRYPWMQKKSIHNSKSRRKYYINFKWNATINIHKFKLTRDIDNIHFNHNEEV